MDIQNQCLYMVYPLPIFLNFQTNISISQSESQINVSGIFLDIFIPFHHGPLPPWEPCGSFGPGLPRPSSPHPSPLRCAAPQSQPPQDRPGPPRPARIARPNCHSIASPPPPASTSLNTSFYCFFSPPPATSLYPSRPPPFGIFVRPINIPGNARPCSRQASPRSAAGGGATLASWTR